MSNENVVVKDITFSVKEEIPRPLKAGTLEVDQTKVTVFPGEITDKHQSYTKNYYLIYHITFDYSDVLGERVAGTADYKTGPIASITYDEGGLVTQTVVNNLPSASEIVSAAKSQAELVAASINKEKVLFSQVNALLNKANTLEGIPHEIYSETGYDALNGLSII